MKIHITIKMHYLYNLQSNEYQINPQVLLYQLQAFNQSEDRPINILLVLEGVNIKSKLK